MTYDLKLADHSLSINFQIELHIVSIVEFHLNSLLLHYVRLCCKSDLGVERDVLVMRPDKVSTLANNLFNHIKTFFINTLNFFLDH